MAVNNQRNYRRRGAVYIPQLVVSLIALTASYYLSRKAARKKENLGDDQPTTLSTRGEILPLIIGCYRVGYLFGWVDPKRITKKSGGGKGFGGGGDGQTSFYESGWHQICVGPGSRIKAIYAGNAPIWETEINRENSPSGSTFTLPKNAGTFTVYWGEDDQPMCAPLAAGLGHKSTHPYMMYAFWTKFALGTSPTWPQIEYVVETLCPEITLSESDYYITDDEGNTGVNLAHALLQILCAPPPHGIGMSLDEIDNDSLEALGVLMQEEQLGVNIVCKDKAVETIQGLLQDAGVLLAQVEGRLVFIPIRETTAPVPLFEDEIITPPDFERTINHGESPATATIFTYKDQRENSYRDQDISFDDDGEIGDVGNSKSSTAIISSFTCKSMSEKVASRRWQEAVIKSAFKLAGLRGARRVIPGSVIDHAIGRLRVTSNNPKDDSPECELEVTPDVYGLPSFGDTAGNGGGAGGDNTAAQDLALTWFELPAELAEGKVKIVVLRTRATQRIAGAFVIGSVNGGAYASLGSQTTAAAGGLITSDIPAVSDDIIIVGPVFEDSNGDAVNILDLSGDDPTWESGKQVAIINSEVFFLQSVTVQSEGMWAASTSYALGIYRIPPTSTGLRYVVITAGDSGATPPQWPTQAGQQVTDGTVVWEARHYAYRLNNLIRAGYGTAMAAHTAGDRVFIIDQSALTAFAAPAFVAGAQVCVKTNPYTSSSVTTNSPIVCKVLSGAALSPALTAFRTTPEGDYRVTRTGTTRFSK